MEAADPVDEIKIDSFADLKTNPKPSKVFASNTNIRRFLGRVSTPAPFQASSRSNLFSTQHRKNLLSISKRVNNLKKVIEDEVNVIENDLHQPVTTEDSNIDDNRELSNTGNILLKSLQRIEPQTNSLTESTILAHTHKNFKPVKNFFSSVKFSDPTETSGTTFTREESSNFGGVDVVEKETAFVDIPGQFSISPAVPDSSISTLRPPITTIITTTTRISSTTTTTSTTSTATSTSPTTTSTISTSSILTSTTTTEYVQTLKPSETNIKSTLAISSHSPITLEKMIIPVQTSSTSPASLREIVNQSSGLEIEAHLEQEIGILNQIETHSVGEGPAAVKLQSVGSDSAADSSFTSPPKEKYPMVKVDIFISPEIQSLNLDEDAKIGEKTQVLGVMNTAHKKNK